MEIIHSKYKYIEDIMKIINQAKNYFHRQGINQWQDGYPNEDSLKEDIKQNNSYVLVENDQIIGTMFFSIMDDPNYSYIEGTWLTTNQPYAVIHRIAVDENLKGKSLAFELVKFAIQQCEIQNIKSIRIDTHKDNLSMQSFLKKHGFQACGTIYLENGDPRIAFEKILS